MGWSDKELKEAYLFDYRVQNTMGKGDIGPNINPNTFRTSVAGSLNTRKRPAGT